jgi:hypothetical protein
VELVPTLQSFVAAFDLRVTHCALLLEDITREDRDHLHCHYVDLLLTQPFRSRTMVARAPNCLGMVEVHKVRDVEGRRVGRDSSSTRSTDYSASLDLLGQVSVGPGEVFDLSFLLGDFPPEVSDGLRGVHLLLLLLRNLESSDVVF